MCPVQSSSADDAAGMRQGPESCAGPLRLSARVVEIGAADQPAVRMSGILHPRSARILIAQMVAAAVKRPRARCGRYDAFPVRRECAEYDRLF